MNELNENALKLQIRILEQALDMKDQQINMMNEQMKVKDEQIEKLIDILAKRKQQAGQ
ncbi:hypothetical protein [Runella sp.]|uniref:hypothetical protein n=1 Tax=Runella sp. TaxID=1960881 RepID=UPI003D0A4321